MNDVFLAILYGALVVWICASLARLQAAWEVSQRQTGELRKALTAAGLKLMSELETVEKLEKEIAHVKQSAAVAMQEQKDRHEMLARSAPPPAPEIQVTSEYPTSKQDKAWIVEFMRDSGAPDQAWEREPPTSLVWARTQSAALDRGRTIIRELKTYSVGSVRPFL